MKKKSIRLLSFVFFLIGIFFLLNSQTNITGAVIGVSSITTGISYILGIVFVLISTILFVAGENLEERTQANNNAKYIKLKQRYEAPSKLEGGGIDVLDYLFRKSILFEREYISHYPQREDESKEDYLKRVGFALENQGKYPKIISKVDSKISAIRDYLSKVPSGDFLTELRRHADSEIREAYLDKYVKKRDEIKGLRKIQERDTSIYKTKHYKKYRERALRRIKEFNQKVNDGDWCLIDIHALNPRKDFKYSEDSYSQCLYFGPEELCNEIEEKIKNGKSIKYLRDKVRKAEIGEAHMIADGNKYSHLHWEIKNINRDYL